MLKRTILSIAFIAISFSNSFAQNKKESIKELFHLMQTDSLMEKTFNAILPTIRQRMEAQTTDPVIRENSAKGFAAVMTIAKDICKRMINEDMVDIYDRNFTDQEIQEFTAFYKTPAGQKMIKLLPDIQKEIMTLMMQKYMPEMQTRIKAEMEKIQPAAPATPAKPVAPDQKKPVNSGKKK
ncbi:DUF2059 domain-containing protein [Desertivirga brevis]|uniref:DUF2059 domain-containing protein n=1 Tax=Desertivirga brevis TaxID=2810310 RepID=UPI001A95737E|nr:DUF2059 domain-containing protein [Pedobacter sp. SYSU D00873]